MRLPWRKVFVFGYSRIRHIDIAVVDNRVPLIVAFGNFWHKVKRSITEPTKFKIEIGVDRSCPYNMIEFAEYNVRIWVKACTESNFYRGVVQNRLDDRRIPVFGYRLIWMIEVTVIFIEPHRQSRQDAGWQFFRLDPPLFCRIARKKSFIKFAPDKTQTLIFERNRVGDRHVGFALNEFFGLLGIKVATKKLIDRPQVDRQRIHRSL